MPLHHIRGRLRGSTARLRLSLLRIGVSARTWRLFRPPLIFLVLTCSLVLVFALLPLDYAPVSLVSKPEAALITEASKELSGAATTLATLTSGMFVLIAVVAKNYLRRDLRCDFGSLVLLLIFTICAAGSFFVALHVRYALARGLMGDSLSMVEMEQIIGLQAWLTLLCGTSAVALIAERILEYEPQ